MRSPPAAPTVAPPIAGPGEIGVLGQRIDEMAQRIAERAELQTALARGDRLASVGVMSAQVAHEINNPLTTVLGYAKLLHEDKPEGHPDRAALELIASEAERMKGIVGGLLEYARTPRQSERSIELTATPAGWAPPRRPRRVRSRGGRAPRRRAARAAAQEGARAARRPRSTTSTPIAIDAHALQQVLVNLVQNAAQAMAATGEGQGGTITIAVRPAPGGIATLITVTDDGPGVPAADRAPRVRSVLHDQGRRASGPASASPCASTWSRPPAARSRSARAQAVVAPSSGVVIPNAT